MEFTHTKSNFHFGKNHRRRHFPNHRSKFRNNPIYSTKYADLPHKDQIKAGWRYSNKIDGAHQLLNSYGRPHAIWMRPLNLEFLHHAGGDLPNNVVLLFVELLQ